MLLRYLYVYSLDFRYQESEIQYPAIRFGIPDCGLRIEKNSTVNRLYHLGSLNHKLTQHHKLLISTQPFDLGFRIADCGLKRTARSTDSITWDRLTTNSFNTINCSSAPSHSIWDSGLRIAD